MSIDQSIHGWQAFQKFPLFYNFKFQTFINPFCLLICVLFISPHLISPKAPSVHCPLFSFIFLLFVNLKACFSTPQVHPGQWSQLAMAPMVAGPPNGDPYDIPRTPMGAPLAIPEVPPYHQQMPGIQVPYHGEQMAYQGAPQFNQPGSGTPYNNGQFHHHHQSDPGDARPMWVPPSPY